jgi:hypothetical protein
MTLGEIRAAIEVSTTLTLDTWLGIVGITSSIFFFFWKRGALPTAANEFSCWVKNTDAPHEDLQVTFRGVPVNRVSTSALTFWNAGSAVLSGKDFSLNEPLRIEVKQGVQVFGIRVLKTDPVSLSPTFTRSSVLADDKNRSIEIVFDFLKAGEGFKVQLIHDGVTRACVEIKGRYSGSSNLKVQNGSPQRGALSSLNSLFDIGLTGVGFALGLGCLYKLLTGPFEWPLVLGCLFLIMIFPLVDYSTRRAGPSNL